MATCLTTIGSSGTTPEFSSGTTYRSVINTTDNALYFLTNELDQSVFFSIKTIGASTPISFTLTIYNTTTLAQFGSLNITSNSVNSSFNIAAGQYYVCLRTQSFPYTVDITPTFISYNNVAAFNTKSYFGISSTSVVEFKKAESICNRKLIYTLIDGALPDGLVMLDNGYIYGTLPMMDCDSYNDDIPTSASWYHQLSDSEYVTNWGRAYRFKVHLTLDDDREKEDVQWLYISVVNNYSKNKAIVDQYAILEDSYAATFEEQVKLNTLQLCPACEIVKLPSDTQSDPNQLYLDVIDSIIEGESNLVEFTSDHSAISNEDVEMIPISNDDIYLSGTELRFGKTTGEKGLVDYYIEKYDSTDNDLITHAKDSPMFQVYLKENNVDEKYIDTSVYESFDYSGIKLEFTAIDSVNYISMSNSNYTKSALDINDQITNNKEDNYKKLPLVSYSQIGFYSYTEALR